jgi:Flp pilus assembly pilin Flp
MKTGWIHIPVAVRTAAAPVAGSVKATAAIEYALLAALIAVALIAATRNVGSGVDTTMTDVDTNMRTATTMQFETP